MNENHRKTLSVISCWVLSLILLTVIGVSFSSFSYQDKMVKLENIKVKALSLQVVDSKGNSINELKFSSPQTGLKPSTGEEDDITKIPYTINEEVGSEGAYAKFTIISSVPWKIELKNIQISKGSEEKENILVAVKESGIEAQNLAQESIVLKTGQPTADTGEVCIIYLWLHTHVKEEIIGAKISFEVYVTQE